MGFFTLFINSVIIPSLLTICSLCSTPFLSTPTKSTTDPIGVKDKILEINLYTSLQSRFRSPKISVEGTKYTLDPCLQDLLGIL